MGHFGVGLPESLLSHFWFTSILSVFMCSHVELPERGHLIASGRLSRNLSGRLSGSAVEPSIGENQEGDGGKGTGKKNVTTICENTRWSKPKKCATPCKMPSLTLSDS